MYDQRQEPNEFVADSVGEARSRAAEFFGVEESELKVVVPADGEIFGSAGRSVIVAVPKEIAARGPRSGGGDRGRGEGRGEGRGDRGGRRERGGRDREERGGRDREDRGRGGQRERGDRRDARSAPAEQLEQKPQEAVADSKGKPQGDLSPVGKFLLGAVERMKLGTFEIAESSEGDFLIYRLSGPAAEALQRGDGRATDALQLVANQVSMRESEDAPRIVVDVDGAADEREDTLGRLADRAVKRARETGRSIALEPMNSRDRRVIHIKIREVEGVATMSDGEGSYRRVLVVPEGAPEYEEAVEQSS